MGEPEQLRRGKRFQHIVQSDFENNSKDGHVQREARIVLRHKSGSDSKFGRADILITELGDAVTILEIKATNWERIKPKNVKKNLWRHQRQLFSYMKKYLDVDKITVYPGIIYPEPPRDPKFRKTIETYLDEYGAPAYWYNEIRTE